MDYGLEELAFILNSVHTIAMVGLSPKPERDSNKVASYLISKGFEVIPVNPGYKEILGQRSYPSLLEIPQKVDLVDIFRRPEFVSPIVRDAIQLEVGFIWMQEGIRNEEAASLAREHGISVVQDLCIMKVHHLLEQKGLLLD